MAVSDNTYSGVSFTADNQIAQGFAQNYGFSIPTGSTINGISITVEKRADSGTTKDSIVSLFRPDGSTVSTGNRANTSTFWTLAKMTTTYGSSSDLWGETWTAEDINDADFGVFFRLSCNYQFASPVGIDFISVTVHYTEGSSAVVKTSNGLALASVKTFNGLALASTKTKNGAATV